MRVPRATRATADKTPQATPPRRQAGGPADRFGPLHGQGRRGQQSFLRWAHTARLTPDLLSWGYPRAILGRPAAAIATARRAHTPNASPPTGACGCKTRAPPANSRVALCLQSLRRGLPTLHVHAAHATHARAMGVAVGLLLLRRLGDTGLCGDEQPGDGGGVLQGR